jgi:signal peptidase II
MRESRDAVFLLSHSDGAGKANVALFLLATVLGLASDLISKSIVFARYYEPHADYQAVQWWVDGVFGIQPSTNPGALFGIGAGLHWVFAAISILFLAFVMFWIFRFGAWRDRWMSITLGMITAGILGNLYDRLGFGATDGHPAAIAHHVRDWILFRWEGISFLDPWPNFNVADSCLVVGALLLFLHGFLGAREPEVSHSKDRVEESPNG